MIQKVEAIYSQSSIDHQSKHIVQECIIEVITNVQYTHQNVTQEIFRGI